MEQEEEEKEDEQEEEEERSVHITTKILAWLREFVDNLRGSR